MASGFGASGNGFNFLASGNELWATGNELSGFLFLVLGYWLVAFSILFYILGVPPFQKRGAGFPLIVLKKLRCTSLFCGLSAAIPNAKPLQWTNFFVTNLGQRATNFSNTKSQARGYKARKPKARCP
ncbi:MAG: hypothetical protein EAZ15_01430 [Sphingobacteriales bacterium]|nr:MAG: hypothetical protein EAZ15_01430 [Sphingobacteriales bacterium]